MNNVFSNATINGEDRQAIGAVLPDNILAALQTLATDAKLDDIITALGLIAKDAKVDSLITLLTAIKNTDGIKKITDPVSITGTLSISDSGAKIDGNATASVTAVSSTVTLTHRSEVRNTGLNIVYLAEGSGGAVAATDFPLYPDETITLKAGTFDAICGAGLTSTLSILKVS